VRIKESKMMKSLLSVAASLAFFAAMSMAQSTSTDPSQGTQGSSPATQQDPGMGQGSSAGQSSGSMGQESSSTMSHGSESKGEKKMKGCIRSEGGQYMLEDRHGKTTQLSGQDLSAHVGHEVTVHGTWASGSSSGASETSAGAAGSSGGSMGAGSSGKTLNVTKVDMISETCTMGKSKGSSDSTQKQ
jgi:hypothetical protein